MRDGETLVQTVLVSGYFGRFVRTPWQLSIIITKGAGIPDWWSWPNLFPVFRFIGCLSWLWNGVTPEFSPNGYLCFELSAWPTLNLKTIQMAQLTIFLRKQAIEFSYTDWLNKGGVAHISSPGHPKSKKLLDT